MDNIPLVLISFMLFTQCSETISHPTNSFSQKISSQGSELIKKLTILPTFSGRQNLFNQIKNRSKRNIRSKSETSHLLIPSHQLMYKIFSPNYKWENLYDLQFINSNGSLCQGNLDITTNCNVVLPRVRSLILSNFTNCEILFDNILNCLTTSDLRSLKINGEINDDFLQQFHELLRKNYGSVNEISLSGLLVTRYNIFEMRKNYILTNVSTIFLRVKMEGHTTVARNIVNERFCSIFPNLVKLGIKQAVIDFDQLLRLQTCRKLKYIKVLIRLRSDEHTRLLEMNWMTLYPSLENIALKLVFDECPPPSTFERLTNMLSNLRKYILCSNCNLAAFRNVKCTQGSKAIY